METQESVEPEEVSINDVNANDTDATIDIDESKDDPTPKSSPAKKSSSKPLRFKSLYNLYHLSSTSASKSKSSAPNFVDLPISLFTDDSDINDLCKCDMDSVSCKSFVLFALPVLFSSPSGVLTFLSHVLCKRYKMLTTTKISIMNMFPLFSAFNTVGFYGTTV